MILLVENGLYELKDERTLNSCFGLDCKLVDPCDLKDQLVNIDPLIFNTIKWHKI